MALTNGHVTFDLFQIPLPERSIHSFCILGNNRPFLIYVNQETARKELKALKLTP